MAGWQETICVGGREGLVGWVEEEEGWWSGWKRRGAGVADERGAVLVVKCSINYMVKVMENNNTSELNLSLNNFFLDILSKL